MNYKLLSRFAAALSAAAVLATAVPASASALGLRASTTVSVQLDSNARTAADAKIDARINSLTKQQARIQGMKKLSADQKSTLSAQAQTAIANMTALKAKIDADTDNATLKADIQSITKSYRVYLVVMPKIAVIAAADRLLAVADLETTLSQKLDTRIAAATSTDVSDLKLKLSDMNAKITDAKIQAQAAIDLVINLQPDEGDKTVFQANLADFQSARTKLKTARADLNTGKQDARTIVKTFVSKKL